MPSIEAGPATTVPARAEPAEPAEPAAAVELVGVTKVYPGRSGRKPVTAVDNVSLRVPRGRVFGLLGPNGAGKSTTIRMIATLLEPTSGHLRICGLDIRSHQREVRQLLGVALGGERSTYWKLTARQNLEFFAALYGHSRRRSRARIREVLDQMDLGDRADDYVETYSTGMRQRLVIARALLNRPRLLLLDEPASGLDPRAAASLHEYIRRLRGEGHTILLTTHDMAEADALSDRLCIIDGGRVIAEGTSAELKRRVGASQVVHARVAPRSPGDLAAFVADLREVATAAVDDDGPPVSLTLLGRVDDDLVPRLIATAGRYGIEVLRVENEPVSLREVFLTLTGRRLSSEPAAG